MPSIGGAGKTQHYENLTQICRRQHFQLFFSNFDKCQSEAAGDVITGLAIDQVGKDVCATFGEFGLKSGRIIWLFGQPDRFMHHFCAAFNF